MKRTFTCFFVLMTLLLNSLPMSAKQNKVVESSDRDKINGIVMDMLNEWDADAYKNSLALLTQLLQYDMREMGCDTYSRLLALKSIIDGTPDYRLLFGIDAVSGHYKVVDGTWVKVSPADDLQFSFTDKDGLPCEVKYVTSGTVKNTSLPVDSEDEEDLEDDMEKYAKYLSLIGLTMDRVKDLMTGVTRIDLKVPEHSELTLTEGSTTILHATIDVDMSSLNEEMMDALVLSTTTTFAKSNGMGTFELSLKNTGYKPGFGINLDFVAKNNDKSILAVKLSAPGTWKGIDLQTLDFGFDKLDLDIDVMGRAQLKGELSSFSGLLQTLMGADSDDEASYKAAVAEANKFFYANLYYDMSATAAATLKLEAYFDEEDEEWAMRPVICFSSDNSSYGLGEFFNAENFPEVMSGVTAIVNEMSDVAQTFNEKVEESVVAVRDFKQLKTGQTEYYTINGLRTTSAAKGMKIVRMSDGVVRKVVTK